MKMQITAASEEKVGGTQTFNTAGKWLATVSFLPTVFHKEN